MHHPYVNIAVKAARQAGNVIMRHVDRLDTLSVQAKSRNDFVTEVDHMAEQEVIRILGAAYPEHGVLAEESGQSGPQDRCWIIDPLDGTTNFMHGFPQYCVSIGFRNTGVIEHGVVFDPVRNEMFTASRGRGAQLNDRRIRASSVSRIAGGLIGTGFPHRNGDPVEPWLKTFGSVLLQSSGVRRAGSAALDLAYVACGRFDGFWERGLKPWDLAAGCLLIEESGGMLSDFQGDQEHLHRGEVVAGNASIHPKLLEIVRRNYGC